MRILGHPVHVMLIHFPSALFPMELVCYALLFFTGQKSYADASYYAMMGAVVMGWLAVLTGAMDLTKIPPYKPAIVKKRRYQLVCINILYRLCIFSKQAISRTSGSLLVAPDTKICPRNSIDYWKLPWRRTDLKT